MYLLLGRFLIVVPGRETKAYVLFGLEGEEGFWSLLNAWVEMSGDTDEWGERDCTWTVESTAPVDPVEGRGLWFDGSDNVSSWVCCER